MIGKMTVRLEIGLGCPPGSPRPSDLLPGVLEGTGVRIDPTETTSRFFGDWTWAVPSDQVEAYEASRDEIASRIQHLYEDGRIRWGQW